MPKASYDCPRCSKSFKTSLALKNHVAHHDFTTTNPWLQPAGKVWDLNGYKTAKIVKRPRRSFKDERVSQVLRHISTQLWAYCKDKDHHGTTMVEVEAMYAGGNVYIGANSEQHSRLILEVLSYEDDALEVLRYTAGGKGLLARRTARFAKKLIRIEDASFDDIQVERIESKLIVDIVATSAPTLLDSAKRLQCLSSFTSTGNLYIVYCSVEGRCNHVEEKFMDILKHAGHKDGAVVAGKMRPCATCFGRMRYMNQKGYDVSHGQNPGFLWLGRLLEQKPKVRALTLKEYKQRGTHTTTVGGSGYASESDSDGESDIED